MKEFARLGENLKDSREKTSSHALNGVGKKRSELENMQTKHMSHNGLSTRIMFGISNEGVCHGF